MRQIRTVWALVQLGRPHFLAGGFLMYLFGVVIALSQGATLSIAALIVGQVAVTAVQLMTHYANDYFDIEVDRANTTPTLWSGGSRVLVEGRLSPQAALYAALTFAAVAICANIVLSLIVRPGILIFGLLLALQALAWFYSAPPLKLHSRGLGELTTAVTVTGLTPLIGFVLQTGTYMTLPLLAVVPLCCLQVAMLLAVEFPDAEGDRLAGKGTLVVRLGGKTCALLYAALLIAPYVLLPLLVRAGLPVLAAVGIWSMFPLAAWLVWRVSRGDWHNPARWSSLAFFTIALLLLTATAELLGFGIR